VDGPFGALLAGFSAIGGRWGLAVGTMSAMGAVTTARVDAAEAPKVLLVGDVSTARSAATATIQSAVDAGQARRLDSGWVLGDYKETADENGPSGQPLTGGRWAGVYIDKSGITLRGNEPQQGSSWTATKAGSAAVQAPKPGRPELRGAR